MEIKQVKLEISKDTTVDFTFWDLISNPVFSNIYSFFMTNRTLYIVTIDLARKKVESDLEYYLQSINARVFKPSIIVVLQNPNLLSKIQPQLPHQKTLPLLLFQIQRSTLLFFGYGKWGGAEKILQKFFTSCQKMHLHLRTHPHLLLCGGTKIEGDSKDVDCSRNTLVSI